MKFDNDVIIRLMQIGRDHGRSESHEHTLKFKYIRNLGLWIIGLFVSFLPILISFFVYVDYSNLNYTVKDYINTIVKNYQSLSVGITLSATVLVELVIKGIKQSIHKYMGIANFIAIIFSLVLYSIYTYKAQIDSSTLWSINKFNGALLFFTIVVSAPLTKIVPLTKKTNRRSR